MPTLRIPTPLRPYTEGQTEVSLQGDTVGAALDDLTGRYPALRQHLFTEAGELRAFVNLFLNEEDVRTMGGVDTPLDETDKLLLIPSIAGGRSSKRKK